MANITKEYHLLTVLATSFERVTKLNDNAIAVYMAHLTDHFVVSFIVCVSNNAPANIHILVNL